MKALSDFIAIILFFATYTATKNIILATAVAMVTGIAQAAYTYWQHRKLEPTQWLSFILVVVFGGLTIALNDRTFIMLKTTICRGCSPSLWLPCNCAGKIAYAYCWAKSSPCPITFGTSWATHG